MMSSFPHMQFSGYRPMQGGSVRLGHVNHFGMPRVIPVENEAEYDRHIMTAASNRNLVVAMFYANWCEPCKPAMSVYEQLAQKYVDVICMRVNFDWMDRLMDNQVGHSFLRNENVTNVPTFVFYRGGKKVGQLEGANMALVEQKMAELAEDWMF